MVVDKSVECGDIIEKIEQADGLVSKVKLFDIFVEKKYGVQY